MPPLYQRITEICLCPTAFFTLEHERMFGYNEVELKGKRVMKMEKNIQLKDGHIRLYHALTQYVDDHGYPPNYRELQHIASLNSVSTVHRYLRDLKDLGYVDYQKGRARSLCVM